jgi:hypothetical protein
MLARTILLFSLATFLTPCGGGAAFQDEETCPISICSNAATIGATL